MKKSLAMALIAALCLVFLSACVKDIEINDIDKDRESTEGEEELELGEEASEGEEDLELDEKASEDENDETALVEKTPETSNDESSSNKTDTDSGKDPEPPFNDKLQAVKALSSSDIGFNVCGVAVSDATVANAELDGEGGIRITSYNTGSCAITLTNSYGEKVAISVSVDDDCSFSRLDYTKYSMPANSVIATDYGMSPTLADNSSALQAAIDAAGVNGTVYIPAGRYLISLVELKEGLTLRLEGVLDEYNTEFDDSLASRINSGDGIAVLATAQSTKIVNHKKDAYARTGVDNITLIGGAYDMEGKSTCFIFCCGENITVKNTIVKDTFGGHVMQITGCKNFTLENAMFVGQNYSTNNNSGEMIQIENGYMGAITSDNTFSRFDEGETHISENVTIRNCYFGKSDEFDAPTFAIGHHSQKYGIAAKGVKIEGCTFDNMRVQAVRTCAFTDVEICNNYFLSDRDNYVGDEAGLYLLRIHSNAYKSDNAKVGDVYLATSADFGGSNNINVHDNVFYIGENSKFLGAIHCTTKASADYDVKAFVNIKLAENYLDEGKLFTGYQMVTTKNMNIKICNNEITVKNTLGKCVFDIRHVSGLAMSGNVINTTREYSTAELDGASVYGAALYNCTSVRQESLSVAIRMLADNTTVPAVLKCEGGDVNAFCDSSVTADEIIVTIQATEGGYLDRYVDENSVLYIEPKANEGYAFDGYYVGESKISGTTYSATATMIITAKFVANEN